MALFFRRPLALACIFLIVTAAISFFIPFTALWILIALLGVAVVGCLIFCIWRHFSHVRLITLLLLLAVLLGGGRVLWDRHRAQEAFSEHLGEQVDVTFVVEEIYTRSTLFSSFRVKLAEWNGEPCRLRVLLHIEEFSPLYLGDRVSGRFLCTAVGNSAYTQGSESLYVADGIYAELMPEERDSYTVLESGGNRFQTRLFDFRAGLAHRLSQLMQGERGDLLGALLLGMRDSLEDSTVRDFRRVGLSHLLAISGLHLMILSGIPYSVLRCLRAKRTVRIICQLLFCLAYLFLSGCSFSILRAILMLCLLQGSVLLKGNYDAFTGLSLGAAGLLLWSPCGIFDLSFQMTMLSTFGILAFGELQQWLCRWIPQRKGVVGVLSAGLRTVIASLFLSFSAGIAVLPVQWLVWGSVSLLSPLSNLCVLPLATPLLVLGFALMACCRVPYLCTLLAVPAGWIADLTLGLTAKLSTLHGVFSLHYAFVPFILIPMFAALLVLLIVDLKRRKLWVLSPVVIATVLFGVCLGIWNRVMPEQIEAIYRNTGNNEGIVLVQSHQAVICDLSNGSYTQLRENYGQAERLGATEVEILMLTHYHERQIVAVDRFAEAVVLRGLWVPEPVNEKEKGILADLLATALRHRIAVTVYSRNAALTVFERGQIAVSTPLYEKRSAEPAYRLQISFGETSLCYESAAYSEYIRHAEYEPPLCDAKYLILGGHGPNPHEAVLPIAIGEPGEIIFANQTVFLQYAGEHRGTYVLLPEMRRFILK